MLQLHPTNRNAGYCCAVCSSYTRQLCMSVLLSPDQQLRPHCHRVSRHIYHYVCLIIMALDQHTCLKLSSYVCNSFTRLAGMLQYPYFKHCFEPTGMVVAVAVAPDHLSRRLRLNSTSMHVCLSCIYQQICLNKLQLTISCVAAPTGIYITLASDSQICPYACTQLTGW